MRVVICSCVVICVFVCVCVCVGMCVESVDMSSNEVRLDPVRSWLNVWGIR